MSEQKIDVKEQIQKMGEKWSEFQKTWVSHFKDMEVDVLEWNFGVGKTGEDTIFEMKAKVAVRQKKQYSLTHLGEETPYFVKIKIHFFTVIGLALVLVDHFRNFNS